MPAKNLQRINEEDLSLHIYNKGVENKVIFNDEEDYKIFLDYLQQYLTTPKDAESTKKTFQVHGRTFRGTPHQPKNYFNEVELIAYSLLPDRFHLILHQKTRGSIERFLRSLCTRYSMYFNKKYHRSGSLFEGPYKSVQIKDVTQLPNLTGFLHHLSNNSSYPEYLGSRKTSWVKPQVVLSLFKNGASEYKDFVEKYRPDQPDQKEEEPGETHQLERSSLEESNLTSKPDLPTNPDLKIHSKIPQFLAISTLGFVVLVAISVRNITISKALSYQPQPTPAVLSESKEATPQATSEATAAATLEATGSAKPEAKPEITLTIKIDDGSSFVNIRQKPTVNSEKIGKANDGDTFEFISVESGWYEIRLADGGTGFISKKYIVTNERNN